MSGETQGTEGLVVLPKGIMSFPSLHVMKEFEGKKNYETMLLWTPASFVEAQKKAWNAMLQAMNSVAKARFGKGLKDLMRSNPKFYIPIRDGMEKPDMDGFGSGVKFITARSNRKPVVLYPDTTELDLNDETAVENEIYGGRHAIVVVNAYAFSSKMKSGVSLGLDTVQLADRGTSFEATSGRGRGLLDAIEIEDIQPTANTSSSDDTPIDTSALGDDDDIDIGI